jgi:nucleoside phosphorylase
MAGTERFREVGVVAALPEEVAPLVRRSCAPRKIRIADRDGYLCMFGPVQVMILITGDGRERARVGIRALLDRFKPDGVLGIGVAGGLSAGLAPGTVLASREIVCDGERLAPAEAGWLDLAIRHADVVPGTLVTTKRILTSAEAKSALRATLEDEPCAVDLESGVLAAEATERGVPYLVLRAIQDTAEESLPRFLDECQRDDGSIDRRKVLASALARPTRLMALAKMARRLRFCARRLCDPAESVLGARGSETDPRPRA